MNETREPWWQVTSVFDPDCGGSDFAYTEGLARDGHPELHMWARPSIGEDPGADWCFSINDTGHLLNEAAWRLVDGKLAVGDTWERAYDEGFVTARFTVHEPVDSDSVDAWGAGDAPVLPIRWELVRPPLGPPTPLTADAQARAADEYAAIARDLAGSDVPPGWELPAEPSWEPEQRFGPRTPLVLARAAQIWQADPERIADILDRAMTAYQYGSIGYAGVVAGAAAREPGRSGALEQVEAAVLAVLEARPSHPGVVAAKSWFYSGLTRSPEASRAWRDAHAMLVRAVTICLQVEAVADLVPDQTVTLGQGVVRSRLCPGETAPDRRWECSEMVAAAVRQVIERTQTVDLVEAAVAWERASRQKEVWPLLVRLWTSAAYAPSVWDVLGETRTAHVFVMLTSHEPPPVVLQAWANTLSLLLSARLAVDPAGVDRFLRCSAGVPGLSRLLNEPLVAGDRR